jgi:ketosteroid isomerase-like protein
MLKQLSYRVSAPTTVLLLSLSCATGGPPPATSDELLAAERAFDSVTAVRRLDGWTSFFADSGREIPDQGDAAVGPAAIREHMQGFFADTAQSLRWHADYARLAAGGDLGYTLGRWKVVRRDSTGEHAVARGKYLTVWRRQPDGSWKVEADIGNTEPPAPAK